MTTAGMGIQVFCPEPSHPALILCSPDESTPAGDEAADRDYFLVVCPCRFYNPGDHGVRSNSGRHGNTYRWTDRYARYEVRIDDLDETCIRSRRRDAGSYRLRGDSLESRKGAVLFQFRLLIRP